MHKYMIRELKSKRIIMEKKTYCLLPVIFLLLGACSRTPDIAVIVPEKAGTTEWLAAKEIRKYIYLRSNSLPEIQEGLPEKVTGTVIRLAIDSILGDQEFRLKTNHAGKVKTMTISGGSAQAVLYGAYEFAEQLGVRFYLHGDVVPDKKISFRLPNLDIQKKPVFATRGILPFHDFPEGPDWWNENDYKAIITQLPKMKMNFIGFHTYPYRADFNGQGPKAEPLVWIGREEELNSDGTVKAAYPVLHFHTYDSTWGYRPVNTSDFLSGALQLFEVNNYGTDYMKGISPWPHSDEENIRIFNESGRMFSSAFELAKILGVKTCVGTETPLVIPESIKMHDGVHQDSENDTRELYTGIFRRIQKSFPVDYYWLWTPEDWTWSGVEDKVVAKTERDMQIAYKTLKELGSPFTLATCGWVLGPPKDRTQFDRVLPKDMPFSCINRGVGYSRVEKGFGSISNRSKWSIPWMEDDPDLIGLQLWAGRIRKDALDSWKYGCNGLFGIHWRTRIIGPNVSALAKSAWECDRYDTTLTGRDLPVEDFYTDWVRSEFGIEDPELVRIFTDLDSKGIESKEGYKGDAPLNASDWISGPGALMVNKDIGDIQERIERYQFLLKLEIFRFSISGAGNLERFDYWLNAFRFNKAILEVTKSQIELNLIVDRIKKESATGAKLKIATSEALPKRIELAEKWQNMNRILMSFVSTNGELGTIANLEMHNIRMNGNLTGHDDFLKSVLNTDLPEKVNVPITYSGKTRIVATTNQSVLRKREDFYMRIRVLSGTENLTGKLFYRTLGASDYSYTDLKRMASHVFEVTIPADSIPDDFEYYIEVEADHDKILYPATAGNINHIVVIL